MSTVSPGGVSDHAPAIRAIPQTYSGTQFRSTLEADWAANLDLLGIAWEYEPEGVQLPSGALYRPDFYLPECETWLEVKGPHDDRIEKTRELGEVVSHYPRCDRIAHEDKVRLLASNDDLERALGRWVAAAPDGDTTVVIQRYERVEPIDGIDLLFGGYRDIRRTWVRRKIRLDQDTVRALQTITERDGSSPYWWPCCDGENVVPWRMVIIGRPARKGYMAWESAQGIETLLIKCGDCGKHSFFDHTMSWVCRRCRETGKVYRGGAWSSAVGPDQSWGLIPFYKAPRAGSRAPW